MSISLNDGKQKLIFERLNYITYVKEKEMTNSNLAYRASFSFVIKNKYKKYLR